MVDVAGLGLGIFLTLTVVAVHYAKGTEKPMPEDIAQDVLSHRAESVPETDFPEPYSRGIGGGSAPAGAVGGAEGEGELEEAEEEESGFDPSSIPEDEIEYHEIEYAKEGETIEVASNESLLDAGEDEDWDLPYACRQGQCVSCAGHIEDGDAAEFIRHENNEVLDEDEMGEGYCLTCVAYPTDSFTLETGESP